MSTKDKRLGLRRVVSDSVLPRTLREKEQFKWYVEEKKTEFWKSQAQYYGNVFYEL